MPENVFVLGLDPRNLETMQALPEFDQLRFHGLLSTEELQEGDIDLPDLLGRAEAVLADFDGTVDAITGYWDFPVSSMVPILCGRHGLPSASLESVVKCEHKYWSRLEQQKVITEHPRFALVELSDEATVPEAVDFPMWVKPVKGFSSELAFRVGDAEEFRRAVAAIKASVGKLGKPFDDILGRLDLPEHIAEAGGRACLAEEAVSGVQLTVEGYVFGGEAHIYGIIDSATYPESASFLFYRYPSRLPASLNDRLADISTRVVRQLGLDSVAFNIEYFWDEETDRLRLLEVNPRHSQSHAKLFEYVDGTPNHQCMVRLALGREPALPAREGPFPVAAKWFLRRFSDGVVTRCPTPDEVAALQRDVEGSAVDIVPGEGDRLSDLVGQDSYSYELADIFLGARSDEEMTARYERCVHALPFEFDDEES